VEAGLNIAGVASLARLAGAWLVLTALVLTLNLQLLTQLREFGAANWLAAELCIAATAPEAVTSIQAGTKPDR
jgi:hypothetical protein